MIGVGFKILTRTPVLKFSLSVSVFVCFDLILKVPSTQSFSYKGMGLPGLNQY